MDIIDSLDGTNLVCSIMGSGGAGNSNSSGTTSVKARSSITTLAGQTKSRGGSSGGSVTVKPQMKVIQSMPQIVLNVGNDQPLQASSGSSNFTIKQEPGSIIYRVVQLPVVDSTASPGPHTTAPTTASLSNSSSGPGIPALLSSPTEDTKLLLATASDDVGSSGNSVNSSSNGALLVSGGGQLYILSDNSMSLTSSTSPVSNHGSTVTTNSMMNTSLSLASSSNNGNTSPNAGLVLPRSLVSKGQTVLLGDLPSVGGNHHTISNSFRGCKSREDKRRVVHNEVERRRRDKINNWICKLTKILPDCPETQTKNCNINSKAGVLAKACDYIQELREDRDSLTSMLSEYRNKYDQLHEEHQILKEKLNDIKNENAIIRAQINCSSHS